MGGPGATVRIAIDRLVLNGIPLAATEERVLRAAVTSELSRLLAGAQVPARLLSGGATVRIGGAGLRIGTWRTTRELGTQVARAIFRGLQR